MVFPGGQRALDSVAFEVSAREVHGLRAKRVREVNVDPNSRWVSHARAWLRDARPRPEKGEAAPVPGHSAVRHQLRASDLRAHRRPVGSRERADGTIVPSVGSTRSAGGQNAQRSRRYCNASISTSVLTGWSGPSHSRSGRSSRSRGPSMRRTDVPIACSSSTSRPRPSRSSRRRALRGRTRGASGGRRGHLRESSARGGRADHRSGDRPKGRPGGDDLADETRCTRRSR